MSLYHPLSLLHREVIREREGGLGRGEFNLLFLDGVFGGGTRKVERNGDFPFDRRRQVKVYKVL